MLIGAQFPFTAELLERLPLKDTGFLVFHIGKDFRFHHHKAGADPATVLLGLFLEPIDIPGGMVELEHTEPSARLDRRKGDHLAGIAVTVQQRMEVDIGNTVAIGHHERFVPDIFLHTLDPAAGLRVQAGVYQCNFPRFRDIIMNGHPVPVGKIESHVRAVQVILREILLNQIPLVAAADDKFIEPVMGIDFHDMPEDREPADLDHRLGTQMAFLRNPGPQTARQNDYFHESAPPCG